MLRKISKKRLAKGERLAWNSTIKAKSYTLKKTPIKKVSDKQAKLWNEAREKCLDIWGHKCFLCGASEKDGAILNAHHYLYTRSQRPDLKYNQSNLCCLCSNCHNHHGVDNRFYQLQNLIQNKLFNDMKYELGTPVLFRYFEPIRNKYPDGSYHINPVEMTLEDGKVYEGIYVDRGLVLYNGVRIYIGNKFITKKIDNPIITEITEDAWSLFSLYTVQEFVHNLRME